VFKSQYVVERAPPFDTLLGHELHDRAQTKCGDATIGPKVTETDWQAWEASFDNTHEEELLVGAGTTRRPLGRLGLTKNHLVGATELEPGTSGVIGLVGLLIPPRPLRVTSTGDC
jgi:hypothetical protein